ncbi:MAG: dioxygenase [Sulfolobaceae archaeon]
MKGVFVSHGSPTILIEENRWKTTFKKIGERIKTEIRPETIIILSPHFYTWSGIHYVEIDEELECIQDYYGFPDELYKYCYSAKNDVILARAIIEEGKKAGLQIREDNTWGLDHGSWIPLFFMFPDRDVKVVTLSITDASFEQHYKLGEIIKKAVIKENKKAVIIATGSPTHRLDLYFLKISPIQSNFDKILINILSQSKFEELFEIDKKYYKEYISAQPEGDLKTLFVLLGAVKPRRCEIIDYDIPWAGVSMLAAYFE